MNVKRSRADKKIRSPRRDKMCHLILSMPFLALALFYFLPFKTAVMIYMPILFLSVFIYYKIKKAMELPPKGGMDEMLGKEGEVVHSLTTEARVKVNDEIWNARSEKELKEGEKVRIAGFDRLTLIVRTSSADSARKNDKDKRHEELPTKSLEERKAEHEK